MWVYATLLCLLVAISIALTEAESFGWATVVLIMTLVVAQLTHAMNWLSWVRGHASDAIIYFFFYVIVGIAWSFFKWFAFLLKFRARFREIKEAFIQQRLDTYSPETQVSLRKGQVPEELRQDFLRFVQASRGIGEKHDHDLNYLQKPKAFRHKEQIIFWMSLWPCSFIGTVLNDPVRRLFVAIFNFCKSSYQKLVDYLFSNDGELK